MPSTDRQTALDLYKSSVELEDKLRQISKQKPPYDKQVTTLRISLRDHYEKIVLLDYELSQSKEVEQNLWRYVYYKFIEDYRKRIRASSVSGEKSKGTPRRLSSAFRSLLQEATGFYYDFIKKLAIHFELKQLDPIIQKFGSTLEPFDTSQCPYNDDIKQKVVLSCHKSLIFLGDLARYRELQSDKPRKNWSTACDYYNNARQLVPESGNPHNQLAVIATYNFDDFAAVYHYYRSLVLRYPFLTAKDNISLLFQKAKKSSTETPEKVQENHRENGSRRRFSHQRQISTPVNSSKSRTGDATQSFFTDFIRLHSILHLREGIEFYSELKTLELGKLRELTQVRALDPDQLLKFTVINMAALFVIRHISNGENAYSESTNTYSQSSKKVLVEKHAALLILDTLSTLLEMCNFELTDVVDGSGNSEQRRNAVQILPAPVKRSLMSIRVGVKWIYSSLGYLARISTQISNDPFVKNEFANFARFWDQFAEFLNTMERLFPHEQGIPLDVPLTEDVELNGFSVLKNQFFVDDQITTKQGEPFEEMDMRIYDIYEDARKIAESEISQLYCIDGVFSSNIPSGKPLSPATSNTSETADDLYLEDKAAVTESITDMIPERDDTNLVESQSFASNSPKGMTNYSPEDEDAEEEVILFTGRHPSVAENDNGSNGQVSEKSSNRPFTASSNQITAEVLLNQVLTSNQKLPNGNQNDQKNYWNHFNTPQLFPNNNENKETSAPQNLEFLYPSTRSLTNNTNNISNAVSNDSFVSSPPFSLPTPISGVPNASLDPLVPSTKRSSNEIIPTLPQQPATSTSSASLFAFPGSDGGVSQFGLFGNPGANLQSFSGTSSFKPSAISPTTINPPPGFSTESNNFDLHRGSPNQSRFQTSNAFGFSSLDIVRSPFQWNGNHVLNGLSDDNSKVKGQSAQGNPNLNPGAQEHEQNSLFWMINSANGSITSPNGALPDSHVANDPDEKFRHFAPGWTPTSIG